MRNHACQFANNCAAYKLNRCQGCSKANDTATKEETSAMNHHDCVMALAMNHDPATVIVGNTKIPVLITDVDSRHMAGCAPDTKFTCQVVNTADMTNHRRPPALDRIAAAAVAAAKIASVPTEALTVGREMHEAYVAESTRYANRGGFTLPRGGEFVIDRVYFNDPVTVVLWKDGTKTIVRCQEGDTYSAETGLALCFAKKALGNKGSFNDVFKKHIPEEEHEEKAANTPEGCEHCRGLEDTDRVMHVRRPGGLTVETKFDYCPVCGRELKNNEN